MFTAKSLFLYITKSAYTWHSWQFLALWLEVRTETLWQCNVEKASLPQLPALLSDPVNQLESLNPSLTPHPSFPQQGMNINYNLILEVVSNEIQDQWYFSMVWKVWKRRNVSISVCACVYIHIFVLFVLGFSWDIVLPLRFFPLISNTHYTSNTALTSFICLLFFLKSVILFLPSCLCSIKRRCLCHIWIKQVFQVQKGKCANNLEC